MLVCNGHYSEPQLPTVQGMGDFPGAQLHSHNYRSPGGFGGQRVLVAGAANSGVDISREVSQTAREVHCP